MNLTPNSVQQFLVSSYVIVMVLTAGMNLVPLIDINRTLFPQYKEGIPDLLLRSGLILFLLALVPFATSMTFILQFTSVTTANFVQLILPNYMWLSLNNEVLERNQSMSMSGSFVRSGSVANAPEWRKNLAKGTMYLGAFSTVFGLYDLLVGLPH